MSDNILLFKIRDQPKTTICTKCVHFKNIEPEDQCRNKIWYNHLCLASPLPKSINYVTGAEESYKEDNQKNKIFTDQEYNYCKDINTDGKCQRYIEFKPTE